MGVHFQAIVITTVLRGNTIIMSYYDTDPEIEEIDETIYDPYPEINDPEDYDYESEDY